MAGGLGTGEAEKHQKSWKKQSSTDIYLMAKWQNEVWETLVPSRICLLTFLLHGNQEGLGQPRVTFLHSSLISLRVSITSWVGADKGPWLSYADVALPLEFEI